MFIKKALTVTGSVFEYKLIKTNKKGASKMYLI
jgi:hypothetical protein